MDDSALKAALKGLRAQASSAEDESLMRYAASKKSTPAAKPCPMCGKAGGKCPECGKEPDEDDGELAGLLEHGSRE